MEALTRKGFYSTSHRGLKEGLVDPAIEHFAATDPGLFRDLALDVGAGCPACHDAPRVSGAAMDRILRLAEVVKTLVVPARVVHWGGVQSTLEHGVT
jgi:hypothetical protein